MHDIQLIVMLAGALAFAFALGALTRRLGLSTLVGYMLAGIVVGPHTPGFVADPKLAAQLAEVGVILLMFGVGQHFHPQELLRVWRLAVPGAVGQSALATAAGWALARGFGWSDAAGLVFGLAMAVASTVVLMRMLVERDRLSAPDGHVAVGWLIVEDLFTVVALVLLPVLAATGGGGTADLLQGLGWALVKVAAFTALVFLAGTKLVSRLLERVARTQSAELFTLAVFVLALGVAALAAGVFDLSVALGAFFAGLVVGQSRFGAQAAADMAPVRDVFSALFFVSVGMLFDPAFVLREPLMVVAVLAVVMVLKPLVAWAIVVMLRGGSRTAATVAVGLGQIGEFSFILAGLALASGLLPRDGMDALVVAAIVSIALNPLAFRAVEWWLARGTAAAPEATAPAGERTEPVPVVLVGTGPLGRRVARRCAEAGVPFTLIDDDPASSREPGRVFGDGGRAEVLQAAGIAQARVLVVADLPLPHKMRVCMQARQLQPRLAIVAAAEGDAEAAWLREFGAVVCEGLDAQSERLMLALRASL